MLHLPETAHLYALLNYAQFDRAEFLDPDVESYLIQTLLKYSEMDALLDDIESVEVIDIRLNETAQEEYLQELADYCLMCTGLMADKFVFEENSFEKLQEVGQSAFSMLSDQDGSDNNVFSKLSLNFDSLVGILQYSQTLISEPLELQQPRPFDSGIDIELTENSLDITTNPWLKASPTVQYH